MAEETYCPLAKADCFRDVTEYHERVSGERAPLRPGELLDDRYLITDILSRGGMGTVFKAEDTQAQGRLVAVKVPHAQSQCQSDPVFMERFESEERIGLELNHPFILKHFNVEGGKSRPYVVTEYLRGCTLEHLFKAARPLPEKDALKIASLICEALQYMHEHGVIHRDLKPQNVMLCCDGTIRIMDFGIARKMSARRVTAASSDSNLGTADYMAPEQVEGRRSDARTDIYNLGALLYEMLAGTTPFTDENAWSAMHARVTSDPVAPGKVNPKLSAEAEEIVLRALQRDPDKRFPSAAAMKVALDCPESVHVTGLASRLMDAISRKASLRRAWLLVAAIVSPVAIVLLVLILLLARGHAGIF
jgi:serine/threonine protein kinase